MTEGGVTDRTFSPELIERYAIRCARGNNGGVWEAHYTDEQKEHWRQFVRELIVSIMHEYLGHHTLRQRLKRYLARLFRLFRSVWSTRPKDQPQ